MFRKIAHRGIAALALVLMLSLVAQPAAAASSRPSDHRSARTTHVWDAALNGLWHAVARYLGIEPSQNKATNETLDRGFGIDPNGFSSLPVGVEPTIGGGN